jgi:hypothetical protein
MVFLKQLTVMFSSVSHSKRCLFISNFFDPFGVLFTSKTICALQIANFLNASQKCRCPIDYSIPGIYHVITEDFAKGNGTKFT